MTSRLFLLPLLAIFAGLAISGAPAQSPPNDAAAISALTKRIEEQNVKIDALSQQILKLQQTVAELSPHVAAASSASSSASTARETTSAPVAAGNGPTHVVTRGETLTSIAHRYKVGIDDLRKLNRIEDDRKLQTGQTLVIPTAGNHSPSAAPSPTASPNK